MNLGNHTGGIAQHIGRQMHVETVPSAAGTHFFNADFDKRFGTRSQQIRRFQQAVALFARRQRRPHRKRLGRRFHRRIRIRFFTGCGLSDRLAAQRTETLEGGAVGSGAGLAVNE